jgi:predicted nucleotidyltransferase
MTTETRSYVDRITTELWTEQRFPLTADTLLLLARVGSHSHGTYLPSTDPDGLDDIDFMGIVFPPTSYWIGLDEWDHMTSKRDELDVVLYSLKKTVRLWLKGNPNVIGLLWIDREDIVAAQAEYTDFRANRGMFSSKLVGQAFAGYAHDQLKRMTAFSVERMERYGQLTGLLEQEGLEPNAILQYNDADVKRLVLHARYRGKNYGWVREFRELHRKHFSGYMGTKRKALVVERGFDTKQASHLIRLLRMGREFMEDGILRVRRTTDAEELRDIKRGRWSLAQVQEAAADEFARFRAAEAVSPLPEGPDVERVGRLLQDVVWDRLTTTSGI